MLGLNYRKPELGAPLGPAEKRPSPSLQTPPAHKRLPQPPETGAGEGASSIFLKMDICSAVTTLPRSSPYSLLTFRSTLPATKAVKWEPGSRSKFYCAKNQITKKKIKISVTATMVANKHSIHLNLKTPSLKALKRNPAPKELVLSTSRAICIIYVVQLLGLLLQCSLTNSSQPSGVLLFLSYLLRMKQV